VAAEVGEERPVQHVTRAERVDHLDRGDGDRARRPVGGSQRTGSAPSLRATHAGAGARGVGEPVTGRSPQVRRLVADTQVCAPVTVKITHISSMSGKRAAPAVALCRRCDACPAVGDRRLPEGRMSSTRADHGQLRTFGRAASMHGYARRQQWKVSPDRACWAAGQIGE